MTVESTLVGRRSGHVVQQRLRDMVIRRVFETLARPVWESLAASRAPPKGARP